MRVARWPAGWGHVPAVSAWQVREAKGIMKCARVLEKGTGRPLCHDPGRSGAMSRERDRKSTRLNSSHLGISYAVFCLKKNNQKRDRAAFDCRLDRALSVVTSLVAA